MQPWILVLVPLIMICTSTLAEAAPYNTFISITRDTTCKKTDCADLRKYIKYDNSTQSVSGKLYYSHVTNDYYRKGMMQNAHNYYNIFQGKTFVFVEPDQSTLVRSNQIILTNSLKEFVPLDASKKVDHNPQYTNRTTYTGVYVDPKCTKALVGVKQNVDVSKVISHLAEGCKSDLGNKNVIIEKKSDIKFCGQECQYQKWLKQALQDSKKNLLRNAQAS